MQLHVKKCIHLMVILLALIETFTGAVVDCIIYTIFYQTGPELDGSPTFYCYFTAHLLPTKHFYRLIVVLYVPILYLWRSRGVDSADISKGNAHGCSRVLGVICTRLPQQIFPSAAGWLWHWLRLLRSTNSDIPVANSSDTDCLWPRELQWNENQKPWGMSIHYSGQQHNSVIKQYNTRVCCICFYVCFLMDFLMLSWRINILLWYCLVGTYAGLPLGVVGSPGGKWLRVVRGPRSPPSWHPLVAGGSASEQARLVKTVKVQ